MAYQPSVYRVEPSFEKTRPEIDFMALENVLEIDWYTIGEIVRGHLPAEQYEPIQLHVDSPDALEWDFYAAGGPYVISERGRNVVAEYTTCFEFLPLVLNSAPFFFLRRIGEVDCFDLSRSKVDFFHGSNRVCHVREYAFHMDRLDDPQWFCVPELAKMFVTESLRRLILAAQMRGSHFESTAP